MRRICCLLLFWGGSLGGYAQESASPTERGDQFYAAEQYTKAHLWYAEAVARDTTDWSATFGLAESLRQLYRYDEALAYYQRVYTEAPRRFPTAEFYYALMLKQAQRCAEALPRFDHFIATYPPDSVLLQRAHTEKQGCYETQLPAYDSSRVALTRLPSPLNTSAQDYAALPYRSDSSIVLTSGRRTATGRRMDYRFGENFTDLILLKPKGGRWKSDRRTVSTWNAAAHDGAGCFDRGYTHFYFTRCAEEYCRIYVSEYRKKKWQPPTALAEAVNLPRSSSKHPALSAGSDTLFFVSDRPDGYGGTDIWMSVRDSSGWTAARNLGEAINTPGDEISPYYHPPDDLLIFASNGRGGAGGMDLYGIPAWTRSGFALPQPLPPPFNSPQDDCFLTMGHRRGFLSSNRSGDFDVYQFAPDTARTLTSQLLGHPSLPEVAHHRAVRTGTDRVLSYEESPEKEIYDITQVYAVSEERLANGSARFILNSDVSSIALRQLREGRETKEAVARPSDDSSLAKNTELYRSDSVAVVRIQTDVIPPDRKGEVMGTLYRETDERLLPIARTEIHLVDSAGVVAKITTTNEIGKFHFVNISPGTRYTVVLGRRRATVDETYHTQDLMVREYGDEMRTVPYETLYFDFNQSALRPEARQSLRDLAQYFNEHPRTAIEINAFTDSLGNDTYNQQLSQLRGQSVFDFLLEQGVDRSSLVINAQGVSTALASTNSSVSQQLNRRVEIQLISENINYYPHAETRIVRPNVSLQQVYDAGVLPDELAQLNGQSLQQTVPLKPLRIPVAENPALNRFFFTVDYQK